MAQVRFRTPVILSSDAHRTEDLIYGFDDALKLVEKFNLNLVSDYKNDGEAYVKYL